MAVAEAVRGGPASPARRILDLIALLLRASVVAALGVMLACLFLQVLMRYVFSRPPSWTDELAVLMFAWSTLGILALGVREGLHVRLTVLVDVLPAAWQAQLARLADALTAGLGLYLLWSGIRFVDMTSGTTSAAIGYPIEVLHLMAPVAGALMFIFALERIIFGAIDMEVPGEVDLSALAKAAEK